MESLYKLRLLFVVLGLMLFGMTSPAQAQTTFETTLSGSNEVPPIATSATGSITATLTGNELVVEGSFEGLTGDYAASHIHTGMAGEAGGVLVALSPTVGMDNRSGTFEASNNTFTLSSGQVDTLMMQGHYINIHSGTYAGGELRAQLTPAADAQYRTNLSGAFEVPAVKTMAYGGAVLQVEGDSLFVSGSFSNLSSSFAASHLHIGEAGSNGGVAFTLNVDAAGDNLSGKYLPSDNRFELSAAQKTSLMNREFYINVHTANFGGGELRGQVTPPVTASFYAGLSGNAEVPSVNTEATGAVLVELANDSVYVSGSFEGLESDFDASVAGGSHIHTGYAGTNGGITFQLNAETSIDLRSGSYNVADNKFAIESADLEDLLNREFYVNIHTTGNGGGELRGQILADAAAYFKTNLASIHEIQPVVSGASGAINIEVNGSTAIVTGAFAGLESEFDAAVAGGAHLHAGPVSGNGGVEVSINTTTPSDNLSGVYDVAENTFTLTETQLSTLFDEGMYANIHTTGNGSGEIRGQLLFAENTTPGESAITSPDDAAMLTLSEDPSTAFAATWETSTDADGNDLAYIWQLSTDTEFNNLVVNSNTGTETTFETTHGTLDDMLAGLGVAAGGTATVYHRAVVTDGSNESYGPSRSVMITRPGAEVSATFEAILSGSNEVPALITTASGSITATLEGDMLTLSGNFEGLSGDFAGMHLHSGMAGQNGGVEIALNPVVNMDMASGSIDTTVSLTTEQSAMLMTRGIYINVHSSVYPGGELRGQIVPDADSHFRANLSGAFEVPAVKTMAGGAVVGELRGDSLFISGSFSNLSGEFDPAIAGGSHLHIAAAGSNGDISLTLTPTLDEGNLSGTYMASENAFELTAEQKTALMNRQFYVNIHTTAFGSGELRGQVVPQSTATFFTTLSGSAEVPSIKSDAAGAAVLELHGDTLVVTGSFAGLESAFDATIAGGSHLHIGHSGENGGVAILLDADVTAELTAGAYAADKNTFVLSTEQVEALINRMMYVNIHTLLQPGGELRGQVLGEATAYFKTKLAGVHEIQPVITDASGAINIEIAGSTAIVTGGFANLSSAVDTEIAGGAHLHTGSVSANGDVIISINTTIMEDTAGVYMASDNMFSLSEDQLAAMYDEGVYANIHTTGFGSGELRGQLLFGDNTFPDSTEITAPVDGGLLSIAGDATTMFEATWEDVSDADGNELNYIWQLSTDAQFNDIIVNASVGSETSFTTDFSILDGILGDLGVDIGSTATVYHRVIVSDGSNETMSEPKSAMLERGQVTSSENISEAPLQFGLEQNYPNPFNPTTSINFTLSKTSNAVLKVYNMLGQEVATLANERLSAGEYSFTFDAAQLSSGMYIYRLQAENQTVTRRMTLIK